MVVRSPLVPAGSGVTTFGNCHFYSSLRSLDMKSGAQLELAECQPSWILAGGDAVAIPLVFVRAANRAKPAAFRTAQGFDWDRQKDLLVYQFRQINRVSFVSTAFQILYGQFDLFF